MKKDNGHDDLLDFMLFDETAGDEDEDKKGGGTGSCLLYFLALPAGAAAVKIAGSVIGHLAG